MKIIHLGHINLAIQFAVLFLANIAIQNYGLDDFSKVINALSLYEGPLTVAFVFFSIGLFLYYLLNPWAVVEILFITKFAISAGVFAVISLSGESPSFPIINAIFIMFSLWHLKEKSDEAATLKRKEAEMNQIWAQQEIDNEEKKLRRAQELDLLLQR